MPEDASVDTTITRIGWQDTEPDSAPPERKRVQKKSKPPPKKTDKPPRPQPPEGVGTKIDVLA